MSNHSDSPTYKAAEAKRLLEDPTLAQALINIESASYERLLGLAPEAPEAHRTYYITKLQVLREIREELKLVIQNGEQAIRPPPAIA